MGFLRGTAKRALQATNGDLSKALDLCLSSTEASNTGPSLTAADVQVFSAWSSNGAGPSRPSRQSQVTGSRPAGASHGSRGRGGGGAKRRKKEPSSSSGEDELSLSDALDMDSEESSSDDGAAGRYKVSAPRKAPFRKPRRAASRATVIRPRGNHSDEDEDSDASGEFPAVRRKRGTTRALREVSATAQVALLDALSGPTPPAGDRQEASMRRRRVDVRKTIGRGCTSLKIDHWAENHSSDYEKRCRAFASLKAHQRVGVRWLLALHQCVPGMILADEMGLGKTAQALCFLELLGSDCPSLVVAPASLLETWESEAARWTPNLKTLKYHSSTYTGRLEKQDAFLRDPTAYQLIITTPQAFSCKENRIHFFRRVNFECLVVDEAHGLKNAKTNRYREISKAVNCRRRLLLTGTPVQNSLAELATLLGFALSDGNNKKAVTEELRSISEEPLQKALEQMQTAAAPLILRRLKVDVLSELPGKTGEVVYCEMRGRQQEMYDQELRSRRGAGKASDVKDAFIQLRRICLHPLMARKRFSKAQISKMVDELRIARPDFAKASVQRCETEVLGWSDYEKHQAACEHGLSAEFRVSKEDLVAPAKMEQLLFLLEKQGQLNNKTLVFSQFTQYLDVVEAVLQVSSIDYLRLDGKTAIEDRASVVSRFQAEGGPRVFLISTKSGGVGLNLTAANMVIMLDLDFNPQNSRQAEDRVHRLGQSNGVTVCYLVCKGTVEEMVLRRNVDKMKLDRHFGAKRGTLETAANIDGDDVFEDDGEQGEEGSQEVCERNAAAAKQCEKDVYSELRAQILAESSLPPCNFFRR